MAVAPYLYNGWGSGPPNPVTVIERHRRQVVHPRLRPQQRHLQPQWDGGRPLTGGVDQQTVNTVRANGGDVIPSFGGYSGNKLESSCSSASALAGAYQKVIDAYGLKAIDIDLEAGAYSNGTVQQRTVDALKTVKANNPGIKVYVTIGTGRSGPDTSLINRAANSGLTVDSWTIMPFDFGGAGQNYGDADDPGGRGLKNALENAYGYGDDQAYRDMGISSMNGITDDNADRHRRLPDDPRLRAAAPPRAPDVLVGQPRPALLRRLPERRHLLGCVAERLAVHRHPRQVHRLTAHPTGDLRVHICVHIPAQTRFRSALGHRIPRALTAIALVATTAAGVEFADADTGERAAQRRGARAPDRLHHRDQQGQRQVRRRPRGGERRRHRRPAVRLQRQQRPELAAGGHQRDGYYRVNSALDGSKAWDVTDVSTADSAAVQLWSYSSGANQQWLPVAEADGAYHFVNRNSGKCLDVPAASTADGVQLARVHLQRHRSAVASRSAAARRDPHPAPRLGSQRRRLRPVDVVVSIQSKLNSVFAQQETNQFGAARRALLFKRVRTAPTPTSASTPRSRASVSPRTT